MHSLPAATSPHEIDWLACRVRFNLNTFFDPKETDKSESETRAPGNLLRSQLSTALPLT